MGYLADQAYIGPQLDQGSFNERYGLFVTLERYPSGYLRGCIGYLYSVMAVRRSITEAALEAAFGDPRFPPLSKSEMDEVTVVVSILSKHGPLGESWKERMSNLVLGRHGLIISHAGATGLLLPDVAIKENFSKLEFLEAVCTKAGLPGDSWKKRAVLLQCFETQIFREEEPNGTVIEVHASTQ